jgi:hypothetical protein
MALSKPTSNPSWTAAAPAPAPRHAAQRARCGRDPVGRVRGQDHRHADLPADRNTDQRSKDYGNILKTFRPGHADYTYWHKYGLRDPRGGGRSSARMTAPMVVLAPWPRSGCASNTAPRFRGHMTQIGDIAIPSSRWDHVPNNPFFAANVTDIRAGSLHGRAAQGRRLLRRAHRGGRARRAGGFGRATV